MIKKLKPKFDNHKQFKKFLNTNLMCCAASY